MKDFPEEYERERLDEMYAGLGLPEEQLKLLQNYFAAYGFFYQRLSLREAFDIFKAHNGSMISFNTFIAFSKTVRHEEAAENFYFILGEDELYDNAPDTLPADREIVVEWLIDEDSLTGYYRMKSVQHGKPLYVPGREELLRYSDVSYFEHTSRVTALENFLLCDVGLSPDETDRVIRSCHHSVTAAMLPEENPVEVLCHDPHISGINFNDLEREKFLRLVTDMSNNTRHPCNRGFTPAEMAERYNLTDGETTEGFAVCGRKFTLREVGFSVYPPNGYDQKAESPQVFPAAVRS